MRKYLLTLSAIVLSIGLLSAQNKHTDVISVNGEGVVKVKPDRVKIKVRVENKGDSAKEVKAETDQVVRKVLSFLKNEDIAEKDYKTDYINLDKKYDYKTEETHYSAQQSITVTLNDVERYSTIMNGLMQSGINRIDGVSFEDSQLEKHQIEARKKAAVNAREKAKTYAEALNLTVGKAQRIDEVGGNSPSPRPMLMRANASASATYDKKKQPLAVGQIEVKEKVNVQFAIK